MATLVVAAASTVPARADGAAACGEYLAHIMDCAGCHSFGALSGRPDPGRFLAGSDVGFELPGRGTFYPPNLTPDAETGLGSWSDEEIILAVRSGVRPDGRELAPVMPWPSYGFLSDEDAAALVAFLRTLAPVRFAAPGPFGPNETPTAPFLRVIAPE